MEFAIIGAGPTGLGAAYRLQELGITDYAVFERDTFPGGLAGSQTDARGFVWDMGVHVMHSHYPEVDRLLARALPDGYLNLERRSWVLCGETFVPYPFQYNIHRLPPEARWDCLLGLLHAQSAPDTQAPESFGDWLLGMFGEGITRHFLLPYNRKIWRVDLKEMNRDWVGDRVPRPDFERVLRNVVFNSDDVTWGPNHTFLFPRHGGTGAIWHAIARLLPPDRKRFGRAVVAIDPAQRQLHLDNGETESYRHLISTVPLPELTRMCNLPRLSATADKLRFTRVDVLGVGVEGPLVPALREVSWLYCAEDQTDFYRLTPFSNYAPSLVPDATRFSSMMCETSSLGDPAPDLVERSIRGLKQTGLLAPDAPPPHTHTMTAPYGYPVPTLDRDRLLAELLPTLEAQSIYSRGRFGAWKYEVSNMDHCLMQGMEVVDLLVNGVPERTLPTPNAVNAATPRMPTNGKSA